MTTTHFEPALRASVIGLALTTAALCHAQEFDLRGTHTTRGDFQSELVLEASGGELHVKRTVWWKSGGYEVHKGVVESTQPYMKAPLYLHAGMAGKLSGKNSQVIAWSFRPERVTSAAVDPQGGVAEARGARRKQAPAPKSDSRDGRSLKGRLLGLAAKAAQELLKKGGDAKAGLGGWAHVSVRGQTAQIPSSQLTAEQRSGLRPGTVWISTELSGGARLGSGSLLQLAGEFVHVGLRKGGTLSYTVEERYPVFNGSVRDTVNQLKARARDAYSLPLTAAEARGLRLGSERTLEGKWNVLLSGGLAVVDPSGASASLTGTYEVRRDLSMKIQRLAGSSVRFDLRRAKTRGVGATAKGVLGLSLGGSVQEFGPASLAFVAKRAGQELDKALRVKLELGTSRSRTNEFELAYRFDLAQRHAARAYERAIRGDLRTVLGPGVVEVSRRVGYELQTHSQAKLGISVLASFERSRTTTTSAHRVSDGQGARTERRASVVKGKKTSWLGKEEKHWLTLEGLWTTPGRGAATLTVRAHYVGRDERTSETEFRRLRGALVSCGFPAAAQLGHHKNTRCDLEVQLGDAAFSRVLNSSEGQMKQAYADAVLSIEGWQKVGRPKRFAQTLTKIRAAGTPQEREALFLKLGRDARWTLYEVAALARLAGGAKDLRVLGGLAGQTFKRGR